MSQFESGLVDILRCEGPWPPEAASPAAHEGARHCPRVTRRHWSLSPDDDEDLEDTGDHRTLSGHWRLAHA